MTRPTGEDAMIDMTDERAAEVLAAHNEWRRYDGDLSDPGAPEMGDPAEIGRAIDHAIAALSAQQPPAEAQPVAWLSDWKHAANGGVTRDADIAAAWEARGEVIPLYAAPPHPSVPVGVEGLPEKWRREAPRARADVGEDASLAWREAVYWCAFQLEAALHTTAAQEE